MSADCIVCEQLTTSAFPLLFSLPPLNRGQ